MPAPGNVLRPLTRRPALSLVVVATLALGIGVSTGIYSIYRTVLIEPLPVPAPERLVNFNSPGSKPGFVSSNNAGRNDAVYKKFTGEEWQYYAGLRGE